MKKEVTSITTTLGEIINFVGPQHVPPQTYTTCSRMTPMITMADIDKKNSIIEKTKKFTTFKKFTVIKYGDLILGKSGIGSVGVGALYIGDRPGALISSSYKIEIKNSELLKKYFYWWLISKRLFLFNLGIGTAQPNLFKRTLNPIEIKKPSLDYQKKVIEILDNFQINIEQREKHIEYFRQLRDELNKKLINNEITPKSAINETKYSEKKLNDVINFIIHRPISSKTFTKDETKTPMILIGDIDKKTRQIKNTKNFTTIANPQLIKKNTILLSNRGSVGIGVIYKSERDSALSSNLFNIQIKDSKLLEDYFYWWMIANKNLLISKSQQTAQPQLTKRSLHSLCIKIPTQKKQKIIVDTLCHINNHINNLEKMIKKLRLLKFETNKILII